MDDIQSALRAKEAEIRQKREEEAARDVVGAQLRLQSALRNHTGGAYITGVDPALSGNDPQFWAVARGYFRNAVTENARLVGNPDREADYDLRSKRIPIQHYLDRLQRRTR